MKVSRLLAAILTALVAATALADAPMRAYRDINFGDSTTLVAQKLLEHTDIRRSIEAYSPETRTLTEYTKWITMPRDFHVDIGGVRYDLTFFFYDDKLYRIRFTGREYTASYFDTAVKQERDNLVNVITQAHGRPSSTYNVRFLDTQAGYIIFSHRWNTNAEGVAYDIGIGESRAQYYASLSISWTWMVSFIEQAEESAKQEQQDDAAGDF